MNDAFLVRGIERVGDLACDLECFIERNRGRIRSSSVSPSTSSMTR
jgi:hypothetical protein